MGLDEKGWKRVAVWMSPQQVAALDEMAASGYYGLTRAAVATELLSVKIRDEVLKVPRRKKPARGA